MKTESITIRETNETMNLNAGTVNEAFYLTECADRLRETGKWEIAIDDRVSTLRIRYTDSRKEVDELDSLQLKILDCIEDSASVLLSTGFISDRLCIRISFTGHRITHEDVTDLVQTLTTIGDDLLKPRTVSKFSCFFFPY